VTSDNKLGTLLSTRRVKNDIKPMDKASEAILALKPVTFRYKTEVEPNGRIQFGLVAEEVAEVDPDLVILDKGGEPESVRYEAINAMLLNEFLKEHKKVEEQQAMIRQLTSEAARQETTTSELKKSLGVLTAQLKEQALQIQKVSAQVEVSKPAPQVAINR
jgi:Chaperone of endosialidase